MKNKHYYLVMIGKYMIYTYTLCTLLFVVASARNISAQGIKSVKEETISIKATNLPLTQVFNEIESKTNFVFVYDEQQVNRLGLVSVNGTKITVEKTLKDIGQQAKISFRQVNNRISVNVKPKDQNAEIEVFIDMETITGKVTDENGESLPGATVVEKGTTNGTVTDMEGNFSLDVKEEATLIVSFVGYAPQEVLVKGKTSIQVTLQPDMQSLEEVVVVGYGTQEKKDLVSSIASISTEDFKHQAVTRMDEVLQGRVSGVQVTNTTGAPGGDVKVRVRGANSILGNNNPLYVVDGLIGADFRNVNPRDIESVEVLKDASATAIYGSRGANGVIIVTTRKGSSGDMSVEFMTKVSASEVINTMDKLNAAEFAQVVNERREANGLPLYFTEDQIEEYRVNGGTDWQDELFRTSMAQEYQLSLSGGNDNTTYFISGNYLDQEGIILESDFKKYAFRTNLKTSLSEKLSADLNVLLVRRENHNTDVATGVVSPVNQAIAWAPTTPLRDDEGNYTRNDPVGSQYSNPLNLVTDKDQDYLNTTANMVGALNYEFIEGLDLNVSLGINYENNQGRFYYGPSITDNTQAIRTSTENIAWQNINNLSYKRTFNKIHYLKITTVFEQQKYQSSGFSATATDLTFNNFKYDNLSLASTFYNSSTFSEYALQSLLGRVNYILKDRYILTASVRRDGSSKFRGSNQFSTFPSAAVGWRVSEEPFMQGVKFINDLKLRASWGKTGSQAVGPYATLSSYQSVASAFNSSTITSGIAIANVENADLKWETTAQADMGFDLEVLEGKVQVSADYFVKNTTDLLLFQELPSYLGGNGLYRNLGEVQNKGWEFSMTVYPVRTNQFEWSSSFNFSTLKNEVVSLGNLEQDTVFTGSKVGAGLSTQSEFVYTPGQPLGSFWGLNYLGTWKPEDANRAYFYGAKPGDARYEDVDGDFSITSSDYQIIGNGQPKYTLGWNNTFYYKALTLNVFFQGVLGFDKLNYTYAAAITANGDARQPTLKDIEDRYIPEVNESSDIPAFSSTNINYTQSSRFIERADFVRLKNISLSYNVPDVFDSGVGFSVFGGATNILTFTGYKGIDPEVSTVGSGSDINQSIDYGAYPNSKTYYLGLSLTF